MKFCTAFSAISHLSAAAGVKILMVSNTNEQPSRAGLYSVDTETQDGTKLAEVDGSYVYVSGAAVCNNQYFAVAANAPMSAGIVSVDLNTGQSKRVSQTPYLAHNLWCYNGPDELLAWTSSPPPPFTLNTINGTNGNVTGTVAGPFGSGGIGGTDSVFQFDPSLGMAWAEFPTLSQFGGGTLVTIDVKTGNHTSYEIERGTDPYAAWPIASLKEGSVYGGLCSHDGDISGELNFCENTLVKDKSGKVVVRSKPGKKIPGAYTEGQPLVLCDGKYYGIHSNSQLFAIDPSSNTFTNVMDVSEAINLGGPHSAGGLACHQ